MKNLAFSLLLAATTSFAASSVMAAGHTMGDPAVSMDSAKGAILVDKAKKMSLYTFRKDTKGKSNCYDGCAAKWPPFMAAADAKAHDEFTIISRKDGSKQWAKDGMPLYFWFKDKKSGDISGHGVKGVWDLARP